MNEPTQQNPTPIRFKPLTEGLGFHPFSNGLPYAPVSKTAQPQPTHRPNPEPQWNGTGATVAGTPHFAFPKPAQRQTVQPAAPAITPAPAESVETFGFSYLIARVVAFGIDSCIHTLLGFVSFFFAAELLEITPEIMAQGSVVALTGLFFMIFNWAMITAQEVTFGTTLGKRLFRLSLDGNPSTIFVRAILFLFSSAVLGLGLVWAIFDRKRRCWHDVATDVQPKRLVRL